MTLLCTQTRVTTPGTTLSETAAATTATPRRRSVTRRPFFVPCSTGHDDRERKKESEKGDRGEEGKKERKRSSRWILFPARSQKKRKSRSWNTRSRESIFIHSEKWQTNETFFSLLHSDVMTPRRQPLKHENRRRNWIGLAINVHNNGRHSFKKTRACENESLVIRDWKADRELKDEMNKDKCLPIFSKKCWTFYV